MKRNFYRILVLTLFLCAIPFTYAFAAEKLTMPAQLASKKVVIVEGTFLNNPDIIDVTSVEVLRQTDLQTAIADLRSGAAQAVIGDLSMLKYAAAANADLTVLSDTYFSGDYVFAINASKPELKRLIDGKIDAMQANGQLSNMKSYWFTETGQAMGMPEINILPANDSDKDIVMGAFPLNEPFTFVDAKGKDIIGYDVELMSYVAQSASVPLFIEPVLQPSQLLPAVESGKLDVAGGFMANDPALKNVLVSKPYFSGGLGVLMLK